MPKEQIPDQVRNEKGGHSPASEKGPDWFLNQVLQIETTLDPEQLLDTCLQIEKDMGRKRSKKWAPREIDVDVLLYGDQIIDLPRLTIPHEHLNDRLFMLVPLTEIAPNLIDPYTGKPFAQIQRTLKDTHRVIPYL
jgi:2-amino-4-hydroxy-6-hydroxymethyldihydropteridine diphosphokinase